MKLFDETHIDYHGESNSVHSWTSPHGQPYYWHPDWLHIAEDALGAKPLEKIDVSQGEKPHKKHAIKAILKHVNEWAHKKSSS
ncbi:hypothetical protein M9194_06885 [Vibrio sp. S4M6]|uniref:hypothetical protein n=1 Tax=Vibrio sinus TaxID=2946865 RepID=UPI002029CABE|nr:hypothetical protein [Vibrio sinus]MCL9781150.1 hypothetical protein [Vibrio sinus]